MEKIIFYKQPKNFFDGFQTTIRISAEADRQISVLAGEMGTSKAKIADFLLKKALEVVEVRENE